MKNHIDFPAIGGFTVRRNQTLHAMNNLQKDKSEFSSLPAKIRSAQYRKARAFIEKNPGAADHNGFWKTLSARHVTELAR